MYHPSLDFLRHVLNPQITGFTATLIKKSYSPSGVYRVALEIDESHSVNSTVIVKFIEKGWAGNSWASDRERLYYQTIYPKVGARKPEVYYVGYHPESQTSLLVMEDLSARYSIPSHPYAWTPVEFQAVLRAYAHLHACGEAWLPPLNERQWMLQPQETRWLLDDIPSMVETIISAGIWQPLPGIEKLVEETRRNSPSLQNYPKTMLHYDAVPPNVALPFDLDQDAVLLDWQDVTWGMAELDLAYLFNQPFSSARHIDREQAFKYYWAQRDLIEGKLPPLEIRKVAQRYADIVMSFTLVAVGHLVVHKPYPEGSYPRLHWDSMFEVLYQRLQELSVGN